MAIIDLSATLSGGSETSAEGRMIMGLTAAIRRPKPSSGFGPPPGPAKAPEDVLDPVERPQEGEK